MTYHPLYGRTLVALCGLYLLVLMHIYQPNMGGIGLSLPINIVGWCVITASICVALILSFSQRVMVVSHSLVLFAVAACLLCVPLLYPNVRWVNTIGRMAGLFGGIIFYATLQQHHLMKKNSGLLLVIILISAWIEALYALLQFFVFDANNWMEFKPGQRAYGIFQQVNVLSSYLATGLGVAVYLLYSSYNKTFTARAAHAVNVALLISVSLFSFVIVLLSSRIGYLGGGVVTMLLAGCYGRQHPRRTLLIILAIAAGGIAAKYGLPGSWLESIAHDGSNRQRIMILQQSFLMIADKPLLGWGYGSFEYSFQHFVGAKQPLVINTELVKHPHNELLYWWVEGGIVALAGMVLIGIGYLLPLRRSFSRGQLALWGLTLPIALHTMTEYPLYQSVPHLMVLVVLLAMADRSIQPQTASRAGWLGFGARALILLVGFISLPFFITGLQTNKVLTELERTGLQDLSKAEALLNPWITWQRYDFDKNTHQLMLFNRDKDLRHLLTYEKWAARYSLVHIDSNVYLARIRIATLFSDSEKAKRLFIEAKTLTPSGRNGLVVVLKEHDEQSKKR